MKREMKDILVVDDSRTVRQLVKMIVGQHLPCRLDEAVDGEEAVAKLKEGDFALVITDINMPRMNGLSLVKTIRGELESEVPIIIVTTMGQEADRDAGLQLGANSFITKPINGMELANTVSSLLPA